MTNERTMAQPQCAKFFNSIGVCRKNIDGVICPRCHHVVIEHTGTGISDYSVAIRSSSGSRAAIVEVKGGAERLPFSEIRDDQWEYMKRWQEHTFGVAWIWLLLGTNQAGSKNTLYPRATYLVPCNQLWAVKESVEAWGIKNLPMNATAAATRVASRDNRLHADVLLEDYRMEWAGNGLWLPHAHHSIIKLYGINMEELNGASSSRRSESLIQTSF